MGIHVDINDIPQQDHLPIRKTDGTRPIHFLQIQSIQHFPDGLSGKRLAQIITGTYLIALRRKVIAGRSKYQTDILVLFPDFSCHIDPRQFFHINVQNDQITVTFSPCRQEFFSAAIFGNLQRGSDQIFQTGAQRLQFFLVIIYQYYSHSFATLLQPVFSKTSHCF